jgi:RNA polymerase sigma-70 factor (ECF subfamily)
MSASSLIRSAGRSAVKDSRIAAPYSSERERRGSAIGVAAEARRNRRDQDVVHRISGRALVNDCDLARMHERIDAARLSDTLDRALDRLAPAEREIFELVAFDEFSVAEAARVAKIRPTAARVRLHRARSRLKGELANTPLIATTLGELS